MEIFLLKKSRLLLSTILLSVAFPCFSNNATEVLHKKNQLLQVTSQIEILKQNILHDQNKQLSLEQQLKNSNQQIVALTKTLLALNKKLEIQNAQIARLKISKDNFIAQLHKQHGALAEQLRWIYKIDQSTPLKTLLNADDINTMNRHIYYQHYFAEARLTLTAKINTTLLLLTKNLELTTQLDKNLQTLIQHKQAQQLSEKLAQKQRVNLLEQLDKKNKDQQDHLTALLSNQKELKNILLALSNQITDFSPGSFKQNKGKLQWPIAGTIIASYGSSLGIKDQRSSGVVIKPKNSSAVHSISAGKVIFANWLRGFGLLIIVNHGNGYMSLYGRNQNLYARIGDLITPQDVIASVGPSKNNANLYFEIRHNGLPMDPAQWCNSARA